MATEKYVMTAPCYWVRKEDGSKVALLERDQVGIYRITLSNEEAAVLTEENNHFETQTEHWLNEIRVFGFYLSPFREIRP